MKAAYARALTAFAALALASQTAVAQPTAAALGSFAGSHLIDFNAATDKQLVGGLYSASGVTFSGALLGMTNPGDADLFPGFGGGVIASNWNYNTGPIGYSFTAAFAAAQHRVGFYLENWPNQVATIEIFSGMTSLGTINFSPTSSLTAEFFGLESDLGFDSMTLTNTTSHNGFFAIDDFQYDEAPLDTDATPEPASLVLLGTGLAGIAGFSRRRKTAA